MGKTWAKIMSMPAYQGEPAKLKSSRSQKRQSLGNQRQAQRLALFNQPFDHYEEKRVGDKMYIKSFNGNNRKWQVAIYSMPAYDRYKAYGEAIKTNQELDSQLRQHLE